MTRSLLQVLDDVYSSPQPAPRATYAEPVELQALRDGLFESFEKTRGESALGLYVLVDPVLLDPLADRARRAEAIELPLLLRDAGSGAAPYLLPLGDFGRDDTIDLSLDLAWAESTRHPARPSRGTSICAWIACLPAQATNLARSLAADSQRYRPDLSARNVRVWDSRIYELLEHTVPPALQVAPEASGWWWMARNGRLRRRAVRGRSPPDAAASSAATRSLLPRVRVINATLDALQDAEHDVSDPRLVPTLVELYRQAEVRWQLEDDYDLIRYGVYGVLVSTGFDQQPQVEQAMQAARARGLSPLDALAGFDSSFWEQF